MRSILSNLVLVPVMAAALTSTAAMAETLQVPFNFKVANKSYPAGKYSVERSHAGSFVTLKSNDSATSLVWVLGPGDPNPTEAKVVLKFDESNEGRVLRSVQYGSATTARLDKNIHQNERDAMQIAGQ